MALAKWRRGETRLDSTEQAACDGRGKELGPHYRLISPENYLQNRGIFPLTKHFFFSDFDLLTSSSTAHSPSYTYLGDHD